MRPNRLIGAALAAWLGLAPAHAQTTLQQPVTIGTPDVLPVALGKLYQNDVFLQGLIAANAARLGAAAFLNVGTVTGTVADGGALAAEITRAQTAEQANTTLITNEVSRAQGVEALKAPLASPAFTGTPTVPTAALGTSTTQAASTAFVANAVAAGGGGGSGGVPTSRQILGGGLATGGGDLTADRTITVPKAAQSDVATGTDDAKALTSFSVAAALGAKAPLASPAFVGTPTAPTATAGTNTTQLATTGFVTGALGSYAPLASPALTGSPTAPTQGAADNSTKLATTAYTDRAATNAVAAVPSAPPVRQTALSGPSASGAPSFLPATTGALSITAQNVSASAPLVLTAAQGFNAAGALNAGYAFTSNPTWAALTANATNFLFVNASTGATSASTLAPIYQFGGTISTANGQFTFDYQAMVGYLGNGTTAVATPLVCIGEAVASASAVTQTAAYAYQGRYQSAATAFGVSTAYTFPHNIGVPIEQLDTAAYASNATSGPWLPNTLNYNNVIPYPSLGLNGAPSTKAVRVVTGPNGLFYDNGSNNSGVITTGYILVRAKRAW